MFPSFWPRKFLFSPQRSIEDLSIDLFQEIGRAVVEGNCGAAAPYVNEIYSDLDDLYNFHGLIGLNGPEGTQHEQTLYSPHRMEFHGDPTGSYMELSDLENPLLFTEQLSFLPVTNELTPSSAGTQMFDSNHSSSLLVGPVAELDPLVDETHLFGGYQVPFFQVS